VPSAPMPRFWPLSYPTIHPTMDCLGRLPWPLATSMRDRTSATAIGISCASCAARILCLRHTQSGDAEHGASGSPRIPARWWPAPRRRSSTTAWSVGHCLLLAKLRYQHPGCASRMRVDRLQC
jgi:hypothetical protein